MNLKQKFGLVILFTSFLSPGIELVLNHVAKAGCNAFGCSQSSIAECNAFGCPNPPMGEKCNAFGCPPSPQQSVNNRANFTTKGTLVKGDKVLPTDGSLYDEHIFSFKSGERIIAEVKSNEFDTYLAIFNPAGDLLAESDDISQENSNSRISVIIPSSGDYRFIVNAYNKGGSGRYSLNISY